MAAEKPYGITNIRAYVPFILDLDRHNYDAWRELFFTHCAGYGVSAHLNFADKTLADLPQAERDRIDNLIK